MFDVGEYVRVLVPLDTPRILIGDHNGRIGCIVEICSESTTLNDVFYHLEFEGYGHVRMCCHESCLSQVTNTDAT